MAFNPFDVFRRNQKTLFAVLTVFVMFMFVLSFGKGDFFEQLPRWLGAKGRGGEVVAVVNGSRVYESDLSNRQRARTLANQFMAEANLVAGNAMAATVADGVKAASEKAKEAANDAVTGHRFFNMWLNNRGNTRMLQMGLQAFQEAEPKLTAILADANGPKEDLDVAKTANNLIAVTMQGLGMESGGYFTNQPNKGLKDALEFDLWLRKAGKLGINLTGEDARQLVSREFFNRLSESDAKELETKYVSARTMMTRDGLYAALADEFKVRAAQSVVLGPLMARNPNPGLQAVSSPYESFQYFRDQCEAGTYAAIAVPAANFVGQVLGGPTQAEMQEIFTKHRNDEPDPTKDRPGLKEPRKLKVEYLEVRGDEPFFKAAGADALAKGEAQAKTAFYMIAPIGPSIFGNLLAPVVSAIPEPALARAYDDYKTRFKTEVDTNVFPFSLGTHRPTGASVVKPGNLAAAAAAAAGSLLTGAAAFTAPLVFEQRIAMEERNDRIRFLAPFLAPNFVIGAAPGWPAVAAFTAGTARLPQPLPVAVVKGELLEKVKADVSRRMAEEDLSKFQLELAKLGAKKDKSEARAYLEKFVAERGLKLGRSKEFRDQFAIDGEDGLAVLKEKAARGQSMFEAPQRFGREFFYESDPRQNPMEIIQRQAPRRVIPAVTFYNPQPYPETGFSFPGMPSPVTLRDGESGYLAWRTDENPAEAPKSVAQAQAKIDAAWRKAKARELAKAAAEDLSKEAALSGDRVGTIDQKLRDLHEKFKARFPDPAAKDRVTYSLFNDVTPQPANKTFAANRFEYAPFSLKPTKDVPYPTQGMYDQMLKNKDKILSTSFVEADAGKDVYYVFTLKERRDLGADEFFTKVYAGFDELAGLLGNRQRGEELRKARETAVGLLKAELKVEKENAEKLAGKGDDTGE